MESFQVKEIWREKWLAPEQSASVLLLQMHGMGTTFTCKRGYNLKGQWGKNNKTGVKHMSVKVRAGFESDRMI